jgi:hypothetical protein
MHPVSSHPYDKRVIEQAHELIISCWTALPRLEEHLNQHRVHFHLERIAEKLGTSSKG